MLNVLGATALAYLAGSGCVTNTAVIGRGLFRSACRAVQGRYDEAAVEALAALAAPALMSYGATASPGHGRRRGGPRAGRPRPGGGRRGPAPPPRRVAADPPARRGRRRGVRAFFPHPQSS